MRLTVVRRGLAVVHTPNKTIYSKDIWDEAFNEKIERKWLEKGLANPRYANLTTCRGYVTFPKMSDKDEIKYQEIKNKKRNLIAGEKGLNDEEEETDPFKLIYNALIEGKIKNMSAMEGMMIAHNFQWSSLKGKLFRELRKESKPTQLKYYFYDKKGETKDEANELYKA